MARFAPVAPIQILEEMKEDGILGNYHLLLAHHVLEYPDRFRALFDSVRNATIIMDNSVVELGASQNEAAVLEACKVVSAGGWVIPVLTDVMGDGAKTRESIASSYAWWQENASEYNLMAVLQGGGDWNKQDRDTSTDTDDYQSLPDRRRTWLDFCKTADTVLLNPEYARISYVGIPRKLVQYLGTRQLAVQYVDAIRPDIATHLLGFSDDVTDDIITAQHPSVEGIDSAVPIRFGHNYAEGESRLYTPTAEIPPRDPDWFEKGDYFPELSENLYNIRKWVA